MKNIKLILLFRRILVFNIFFEVLNSYSKFFKCNLVFFKFKVLVKLGIGWW